MSQIVNEFTQFNLTETEQLSGQIFSQSQLQVLQNLRAQYAVDKLNLKVIPNDYQAYVQQEAGLAGALSVLSYIIDCHHTALAIVMDSNSEIGETDVDSAPYTSTNSDTSNIFK